MNSNQQAHIGESRNDVSAQFQHVTSHYGSNDKRNPIVQIATRHKIHHSFVMLSNSYQSVLATMDKEASLDGNDLLLRDAFVHFANLQANNGLEEPSAIVRAREGRVL